MAMRQIGAFSTIAIANSLSCATHVKNLSRHNALALNCRTRGSENNGQVALPHKNIQMRHETGALAFAI